METAARESSAPAASWIIDVRRRPEAVLVEREAGDRQRVVDVDRLAGDLLAVLVDGEVGGEVGEGPSSPRRGRRPEVLDDRAGPASRSTGPWTSRRR